MPKITIIVPTYNVEQYIDKCLHSLEHQTFQDFDVLVIDDGSKQNEKLIIDSYTENNLHRFKYIRKENGGYGSVLELGIKMSDSKYILICDPDDWLEVSALDILYKKAELYQADIVCGTRQLVYTDSDSFEYDPMYDKSQVQLYEKLYQKGDRDFGHVYQIENAPHSKLFLRKNLVELKFPSHSTNTDTILFFGALFLSKSVYFTTQSLSFYLINRVGNTVTDVKPSLIDGLTISHLKVFELSEQYEDIPSEFYYQMFIAYQYIVSRMESMKGDEKLLREKFKETSELLQLCVLYRTKIQSILKINTTRKVRYYKQYLLLSPVMTIFAQKTLYRNLMRKRTVKKISEEQVHPSNPTEQNVILSVIVPVYNVEKYISRCLDSLLNQSYKNIEIIVVNDGSSDQSQEVIDTYHRNNPAKIKSYIKDNGGLSDARNYGLKWTQGKYVAFIDSDDWVDHSMFESMLSKAEQTQSDIIVCDMEYVYEDGSRKFASGGDFDIVEVANHPEIMFINNSACNKIYTRELFKTTEFVKGIWYEDLATIPNIILASKRIAKVSQRFYKYFQRETSIVHTKNPKIFDIYIALDLIKDNIVKSQYAKELKNKMDEMYLIHGLDLTLLRIKDYSEDRKEYLNRNLRELRLRISHWYFKPFVWRNGFKKWLVYSLYAIHAYSLLLNLFDRKGHV